MSRTGHFQMSGSTPSARESQLRQRSCVPSGRKVAFDSTGSIRWW